jgi:hypothetical protein
MKVLPNSRALSPELGKVPLGMATIQIEEGRLIMSPHPCSGSVVGSVPAGHIKVDLMGFRVVPAAHDPAPLG